MTTAAKSFSQQRTPAPRQSTIAFVKQFARAYRQVAGVPSAIGGFVAN
jgi:hypothetical protein